MTSPSWALIVSASCYVGNVKAKSVKAFSSFKLLVVFWKIKKVYVAQELLGMWNLKL